VVVVTANAIPLFVPGRPARVRSRAGALGAVRQVPVSRLAEVRQRSTVYAMSAVDVHGRVAAQSVVHALRWKPMTRLAMRERAGLILVTADQAGAAAVTREGHLRVPPALRSWCTLSPGSRVLLAANPDAGHLVIHPPADLDVMTGRRHAEVFGGDLS
jgi:predicted short-subunit dehydrogenase-like oxidoreductase (DUF2520 family)